MCSLMFVLSFVVIKMATALGKEFIPINRTQSLELRKEID